MQSKVRPEKNDAHVASTPASMVALKACASASSIIFFWPDFISLSVLVVYILLIILIISKLYRLFGKLL